MKKPGRAGAVTAGSRAFPTGQGGGITVTPKNADLVVVSPQAGNCFDMAEPWQEGE